MSKTKREQNTVIIYFWFYLLLSIVLVFTFISFIFPSIKEIETIKVSALDTYNAIQRVEKEWVSFDEFNQNISWLWVSKDLYLSQILKNVDSTFYNDNIKNTTDKKYSQFIDELSKKYSDTSSFDAKIENISKILPVYSEGISDLGENFLSDYKFINYIESIAETFNISFPNSIWISEVSILEDYSIWVGDTSLEKNIFYIPLSLDITWTKESIINFLYFAQNIWSIKVDGDNIEVINTLDKDFSDFKNKVLKGQVKTPDYNIFNNQIFDIESINFADYIDSSFDINNTTDSFINYIRNTQWNERYNAKVKLRFYVKWIPMFKIEKFIQDFVVEFNSINQEVLKSLWRQDINPAKRQKLQEIKASLDQLQTGVLLNIQKSINTKVDIDKSYMSVTKYNLTLKEYRNYLEQIKK